MKRRDVIGKGLTVPQAARMLECPEAKIKRLVKQERIAVIGRGPNRSMILDYDDVHAAGVALQMGEPEREIRAVIVIHGDGVLDDVAFALKAAQLTPLVATGVMDALSLHETRGLPIIIFPGNMSAQEHNLLAMFQKESYQIVVGDVPGPPRTGMFTRVDPGDLRSIVRYSWKLVEQRQQQVQLKL